MRDKRSPDFVRVDYSAAKSGLKRSILLVYLAGFCVVLWVGLALFLADRMSLVRVIFNLAAFQGIACVLAGAVYLTAVRDWLRGQPVGEEDLATLSTFGFNAAAVRVLASVAERRDPYTAAHQKRVSHLAGAIASEMSLAEERVEGVRVAGLLHDTGKVVIPAEILSKPCPLSEFEFGIVKTHPKADWEILEGIEFPWPVAEAVLQHHERMDGSGYPRGLEAAEIIQEARILAVADVVEAMASHRPHRPAYDIDTALDEIEAGRGNLFDPRVADACLALFREKGYSLA